MLEKLGKKDKEQYQSFWNEFGQVLKEGPAEDQGNKEQVANLLRFASTEHDTAVQSVSIPEYVERMKEVEMEKVRKERRSLEQRERNLKMVSNTSKRERDELDRAQKDLARL